MSLIARMIEAGVPADIIEDVAMLVAEKRAAEKAIETRRANDRDRTNRRRLKDESQNVTGCHVTQREVTSGTEHPLSLPPNEIILTPPPIPPENNLRARKGTRLPVDWQPKPLPADLAAVAARAPEGAIERELARFRDWAASATGPNAVKSNWDAAWRNWLRKADDEGRLKPRNDRNNPFAKPTTREIGERVAAQIAARRA